MEIEVSIVVLIEGAQWLQTKYGDIEFGFYPKVAPRTVAHILKLVKLGAYNTNHFFRVSSSLFLGLNHGCTSVTGVKLDLTLDLSLSLLSCSQSWLKQVSKTLLSELGVPVYRFELCLFFFPVFLMHRS